MPGWIKVYRSTQRNWIFENAEYFRAWVIILFEVNVIYKKNLIDGELIDCDRGQKTYSISTWVGKFGMWWSPQKVRTFFKLLEKDKMITLEGLRKTTRLSVCNYLTYQDVQQADNKQTYTEITNSQRQYKNDKNEKNEKNEIYRSFSNLKITGEEVEILKEKFNLTNNEIDDWIDKVENWPGHKKKTSLKLTLSNWINKDFKEKEETVSSFL